eukprot:403354822
MRRGGFQKPAIQAKKAKFDSDNFESSIGINFEELPAKKIGYLANFKTISFQDQNGGDLSAILMYFIEPHGQWFKAMLQYEPYFYILCANEAVKEIVFYLNKTFENTISKIDYVDKEDLNLINHLSGKTQKYLKLSFKNIQDLVTVRNELQIIVQRNLKYKETMEVYEGFYDSSNLANQQMDSSQYLSKIYELREYDVNYHIRVAIDLEIRTAFWYEVDMDGPLVTNIKHLKDKLDKADLRILAFDIETTKAALKFPDSRFDQIMMISYVIDGKGFLITNRQIVGGDVEDFEYSPKPEYDIGIFTVFNEADEKGLLDKFFSHIRETRPFIFTTFNGDFFDWVFIQDRCKFYDMTLEDQIGVYCNSQSEYSGRFAVHMDCFYWVQRDAYLPQGSHGLKAVTKAKLGYDPVELDPELMVPYAKERPQELAEYSVSDAVATYFLYQKMIHDFIFALCTIIPTNPDEVLRKGSGTLCEDLLMAQAFRCNIIFPNKQSDKFEKFYHGHLIDSDTYIGGHVECLRTGVYRSDIPVKFRLEKAGYQHLIDQTEAIMDFALKVELNVDKNLVTNYDELRDDIIAKLQSIQQKCPSYEVEPLIYHVDVAAMYPNIILSNRLQPVAIVNEQICAGCIFNKDENNCKRNLNWQWKGEYFPLTRKEYEGVKTQLEYELEKDNENKPAQYQREINLNTQNEQLLLKQRVKKYCSNVYKHVHQTKIDLKSDTVCMRENSFYVDTVRDFRDRRYDYKHLVKVWAGKYNEAVQENNALKIEEAKNLMNLYESLQLAHKIILNSFYGYVMRRGARWYSMEMAAMVTHTGGSIIMDSRSLYDQIGMPLELDTDGIWTLLPKGFPEQFSFQLSNGKKANFSFICTMSNVLIYDKYGNKQYQTLVDKKTLEYETRTEMSVFFEIDGPYRAMVIPASKEENKMLKKRYAVFNHAGKMTEVKGFELKRRGELKLIKIFQEEVFSKFLEGKTLQECYDACGEVAERWYDILDTEGEYVDDSELIEYIGESRFLSKALSEYDGKKASMVTCAHRLSEFLGPEIVKGKGINVKFIISRKPVDAKIAQRAIPTAIFEADPNVMKKFLRKWMKDAGLQDFDMRSIIDWQYYKDRVSSTIQKIITIPAALQKCLNPVPRIQYPDWLHKRIKVQDEKFKQKDMKYFFKNQVKQPAIRDIEDSAQSSIAKPIQKLSLNSSTNQVNAKKPEISAPQDKYGKIEDCPPPEDNFKDWLKYQKSNWRKIRKDIKEEKQVIKQTTVQKSQGLNSFIRNMDEVVLKSTWHILQISETFEPGVMKVWAMTESGQMFAVKLKIPRTIYINSKTVCEDADFKKVQKILPRERKAYHLYEWESSEDTFLEKFHNLTYHHLMNPTVEGVYETKMPLVFKAITELGCLVKPRFNAIPKNEQALGRTYSLKEFEQKQIGADSQYMPSTAFDRIYLLQSQSQNNRHFWGLFIEQTKEIQFFVVNPVANAKNPALQGQLNYKSLFSNTLQEAGFSTEYINWEISNNQNTYNELNLCLKAIDQKLIDYKSKVKSATVVVLQSELTPEKLMFMGLPTLANEFPCMKCQQVETDQEYPALDWIRFACKNMSIRFTEINDWVRDKINFARYSFVPVCNLDGDSSLFIIDTLYARNLSQNRHILWYSDTSKPDLGGHEDKDFRIYFQDEIENPEIIQKGFYRNYTVEIDITEFALNTILQSEYLKDFEEASMLATQYRQEDKNGNRGEGNFAKVAKQDFDNDLDEYVTCAGIFKRLRDLVNCWIKDIIEDDQYADRLTHSLYRWITSPTGAKLYDPLLHRLVHQLMKKTFYQMIYRLKKLGCQVIYANFHKLIIHTQRDTFEEAENFINFVTHTIKQDPMFSFITMTPNEYYKILLFKDYYNFGGIKESNPSKVSNKWDICLHLPEAIQKKFLITIGEFILKVYKHNKKMLESGQYDRAHMAAGSNQDNGLKEMMNEDSKKIESYMDTVDDIKKERDHDYIVHVISEYFSQKLFPLVGELLAKKEDMNKDDQYEDDDDLDLADHEEGSQDFDDYDQDENDQNFLNQGYAQQDNRYVKQRKQRERERKQKELKKWEFPQRIGSYNDYKNAALEFSKQVCKNVFGLDEAFQTQVTTLKRNLLSIIREKEFSTTVVSATEPSLILVVPDVICTFCQTSKDLDICRDPSLNKDLHQNNLTTEQISAENSQWFCQQCDSALNKGLIERRLVELLNRRAVGYQIQDLKCIKCLMVKNTIVSRYCQCTGQFKATVGYEKPEKLKNSNLLNNITDIKLFVQLMRNFGTYHNMPILKDTAQQLMILYN